MKTLHTWIEAMRLRTLPVSLAGVVSGVACALIFSETLLAAPALLCMAFAILAQIASNFANEYFDYKAGIDRPGREGPRRGVTEGDITPRAMLIATIVTIAAACAVGLPLVIWGGWWLVIVGAVIAVALLAYSAGPWPLSSHGLGEVAVLVFFGLVPVTLTFWLVTGMVPMWQVWCTAAAVGLLGANVLVVNNYRDLDDDKAVGKCTIAVMFGRRPMEWLYLANGLLAMGLTAPLWWAILPSLVIVPALWFLVFPLELWHKLRTLKGAQLNPLLGATARAMALYALVILAAAAIKLMV